MKISYKTLVILVSTLMLTACASAPEYRKASGSGLGYSEQEIAAGHYNVVFRARGDDARRAGDYAMLRASELTIEKGYDWFGVLSRETLVDRERIPDSITTRVSQNTETYQSCGLLGCTTRTRPARAYDHSMVLGNERSEVVVTLEINMGKGTQPEKVESHDARIVFGKLNPDAS